MVKTDLSTGLKLLKFNYFCYVELFYVRHVHKESSEVTMSLGHSIYTVFSPRVQGVRTCRVSPPISQNC